MGLFKTAEWVVFMQSAYTNRITSNRGNIVLIGGFLHLKVNDSTNYKSIKTSTVNYYCSFCISFHHPIRWV